MKILFLNPHVDAQHPVAQGMERRGIAVLYPANSTEAFKMLQLHGSSVDLAIIHREALPTYDPTGLSLIQKIKSDPSQADLPFILTTERWSDAECAKHQKTPQGANAYLRYPFTESAVVSMIEAVTGQKIGTQATNTSTTSTIGGVSPGVILPAHPKKPDPAPTTEPSGIIELANESTSNSIPTAASGGIPSVSEEPPKIPTATITRQAGVTALPSAQAESPMAIELSEPPAPQIEDTGSIILEAPPVPGGAELSPHNQLDPPAEAEAPSSVEISVIGIGKERDQSEAEPVVSLEPPTRALNPAGEKVFELPPEPSIHYMDASAEGAPVDTGHEPTLMPSAAVSRSASESDEAGLTRDLPYLFPRSAAPESAEPSASPSMAQPGFISFAQPVGDAVVPGGAAHTPDLDTLKKYLLLREQDVAALSSQLRSARDQLNNLQEGMRVEKAKGAELAHTVESQKRRIDDFEREKAHALDGAQSEVLEVRFQLKAKSDRARVLETQVREAAEEMERLKERVRTDIRKIRVREKELESKLEIMKKDAEALIAARENKIIELKRKLDLLEFNMDLLQDKYTREKDSSARLRERLTKAAQAVRVAGGVLDPSVTGEPNAQDPVVPVPGTPDRRAAS